MTTVVLATQNRHKVAELRRILREGPGGNPVTLLSGSDLELPDVEETGRTFAENALLKARAAHAATGLPCVADDSGLAVDALGGEPGVRSARYAGAHGDDDANLALVVERMAGIDDRRARFVCAAALVADDGEWVREGTLEGTLADAPRGDGGFGYDPILVPDGETRTCAELAPEEKDAISHRGKAFRAVQPLIAALPADDA
jgi:XTP/dITP diphosphohydrolase